MTPLKRIASALIAAVLTAWHGNGIAAAEGPYDGSKPLLCAVSTIMECDNSGQCERHLPEPGANTPTFFRVDFGAQMLTGTQNRKTALKSITRLDGQLILQGGENGRGWSATIAEDSGRMAAAVVDNDLTFSIFGFCTVP
jgi:hypothetical protein